MMFRTHPETQWTKRLQKTGASDDGWTIYLVDPETKERWVKYFPYYDTDRAPSIFRREDIPQDPEELLRLCLTSDAKDDWQGVGAHASEAFDVELIAKILEKLRDTISAAALREFGRFFQPSDKRNIIGMNLVEVSLSYERYKAACARIAKITKGQK